MSIQVRQPAKYQGLQDLFPGELRPGVEELIRRLTVNHEAIASDVADQAIDSTGTTAATTYETKEDSDARMALQLVTE